MQKALQRSLVCSTIIILTYTFLPVRVAYAGCQGWGWSFNDCLANSDDFCTCGSLPGGPDGQLDCHEHVTHGSCTTQDGQPGILTDCRRWTCDGGDNACGGGSCFTAGTKVATPGGEQVIETVKVGDTVESFDPASGAVSASKVGSSFTRFSDSYYVVKTESGRQIEVTGEHPLYTGTAPQPPKTLTQKLAQAWYELSTDIRAGWLRVKEAIRR